MKIQLLKANPFNLTSDKRVGHYYIWQNKRRINREKNRVLYSIRRDKQNIRYSTYWRTR